MNDGYGRKHFKHARFLIRDLVSVPVQTWMTFGRARRTAEGYRALTDIPMDLAAAGFTVTVSQSEETGWHIEVSKTLTPDAQLHLVGEAQSYVFALFQVAEQAGHAFDDLEAAAKRAWEQSRVDREDAA